MTTKIQYSQSVITRGYDQDNEKLVISKPESLKTAYKTLEVNIEDPACTEYGFILEASSSIEANAIELTFNRAIFNDSLVQNVSGGLYQKDYTLDEPRSEWGENRFGTGQLLSMPIINDSLKVILFKHNGSLISIEREYSLFSYNQDQQFFYDIDTDILYINSSKPISYGPIQYDLDHYDDVEASYITAMGLLEAWEYLNNFQYVVKQSNSEFITLYAKYFPLYSSGAIVVKTGMDYFQLPSNAITVNSISGLIVIDTSLMGYDIEDVDGFYIVYGAVPAVISNPESLSKNLLDIQRKAYATYLTIDTNIYSNVVLSSPSTILMKKGTEYTRSTIEIEKNDLNTYVEISSDLTFENFNRSTYYVSPEDGAILTVMPNVSTLGLREFDTGNAASGLITVQLEDHWRAEDTETEWQTIMNGETSAVALFGKFGDVYKLMSSDQYKNGDDRSAVTTYDITWTPNIDGYVLTFNHWYDPTTLSITNNADPLVEGVDYELSYPDTIIFLDTSILKDEPVHITFDVAVDAYIYDVNIDVPNSTVAFQQYKDIWTIYGSELESLHYLAAYSANVYVGKINTDLSKTVTASQTITAKVNTTANYIKQLFTGLKGYYPSGV